MLYNGFFILNQSDSITAAPGDISINGFGRDIVDGMSDVIGTAVPVSADATFGDDIDTTIAATAAVAAAVVDARNGDLFEESMDEECEE
jgi:hypothetical protein